MQFRRNSRRLGWLALATFVAVRSLADEPVRIDSGLVAGTVGADPAIRVFRGIPFAAPPVGELRWREPRPVAPWSGVRSATQFGPTPEQGAIYTDAIIRNNKVDEDCLYLNVWTPAKSAGERLPVMVWIYGGGYQAGSSSEPRHDGENLARKGVVLVTLNYRLGVFGFLVHPELTRESGRDSSGDYGLMDQIAALGWVQRNIAAFGGDPANVTVFGESVGSISASMLMTSPLARGLFQKAIGESGALFGTRDHLLRDNMSLAAGEKLGLKFQAAAGAKSLAELRAMPAEQILKTGLADKSFEMWAVLDGYVLPKDPFAVWTEGRQSHVPLLAGWNADEIRVYRTFGKARRTAKGFIEDAHARFGPLADEVLRLYPAGSDEEANRSAGDLEDDLFVAYSNWKWIEMQLGTGDSPVYRYSFDMPIPVEPGTVINGAAATGADVGAVHSGEIVYVFGSFGGAPKVPWRSEDRRLSDAMGTYWTNFARTGDPNGPGVPAWPRYRREDGHQVMHLGAAVLAAPEARRDRYEFWDAHSAGTAP